MPKNLPFSGAELRIDAAYRNTNDWNKPADEFNRFFRFADKKGINNTSGFRPKSRASGGTDILDCAFCLLVTTFGESEWPDQMDRESGRFTYYGDNRSKGTLLHDTAVGGNRLLSHVYALLHSQQRAAVPPFLCFESFRQPDGSYMRFLGLAAPGAAGVSALEDLVAVWRVKGEERFQNYRAVLSVLKEEAVTKQWLDDLVSGAAPTESRSCPATWRQWVTTGRYSPLQCVRKREARSRADQQPKTKEEREVLGRLYAELTDREFEFAAADLLQLMDERFREPSVTRAVRDGGRDVIAAYQVGHAQHQIHLSASLEAKRWNPVSAVGVKPMMRLIARLKHRDIGVFVTTSFFDLQVQRELLEDGHPVILLAGGDVARLLISKERGSDRSLSGWIEGVKTLCAAEKGTIPLIK